MQQLDISSLDDARLNNKFCNIGAVATLVNEINQVYKTLGEKLSDYAVFYRGHADVDFKAVPSIYRKNPETGHCYVDYEENLCSDIVRECPSDFERLPTAFDMLVKMQHYTLPTRLLDITENPFVALYFACLQPLTKGNNGEIQIYFVHKDDIVRYSDLQVGALSSISFLPAETIKNAKTKRQIGELSNLMRIYTTQPPFIEGLNDFNKTLCVLPKKSNPRISRQQGAFFLFGIKDGDKTQMSDLDIKPFSLIVDDKKRGEILSQLERYAINEKFLFPEIDKVANHLRTHI